MPVRRARSRRRSSRSTCGTTAILVDRAELGDPCTGFEAIPWEDPEFTGELVDVSVTQVTEEDALLEVALGPGEETFQTVRMVYHRAHWRVFSTEDRTGTAPTYPSAKPARRAGSRPGAACRRR